VRAGVSTAQGAEVFFVERTASGFRVHAERDGHGLVVDATCLVVATGAMERAVPFPGWTLPGVIGAGAAQRLLKTGGTAPGHRVVLAGSGPFLLAVAKTFAEAGVPLARFVEAVNPGPATLAPLARMPARLGEAAGLVLGLLRSGARPHFGWAVVAAEGRTRVEAVRLAPVRDDGRADLAAARTVEGIDAVCVGYGFRPVIDVTALLGARHDHDDRLGGWACRVDPATGATDVPGLFAAGETTGIGGWLAADLSGTLAGRAAAARSKGREPATGRDLVARLERARAFAIALTDAWPFPAALAAQLAETAVVCRCEDVTADAIRAAVADGARTAGAVKMWTRAGMGPCQGRVCGPAVAALVGAATGGPPETAGFNRPQLPLRPVPLAVVEACLAVPAST
jgi:bacterioferritin-associated ferredoxin/thioredoxin reductase